MPVYTSRVQSHTRVARHVAVRPEWWPWAHSMIAGSGVACVPQVERNAAVSDRDPRAPERRQ